MGGTEQTILPPDPLLRCNVATDHAISAAGTKQQDWHYGTWSQEELPWKQNPVCLFVGRFGSMLLTDAFWMYGRTDGAAAASGTGNDTSGRGSVWVFPCSSSYITAVNLAEVVVQLLPAVSRQRKAGVVEAKPRQLWCCWPCSLCSAHARLEVCQRHAPAA